MIDNQSNIFFKFYTFISKYCIAILNNIKSLAIAYFENVFYTSLLSMYV